MNEISRQALFAKLNPLCFKTLEGATVLCKLRGNPHVELAHWFNQILSENDSDWHHILRQTGLDLGRVVKGLTAALEALPAGEQGIRDLSEPLLNAVERAWVYASLKYNRQAVRSADLLVAVLSTPSLARHLARALPEVLRIDQASLNEQLESWVAKSVEANTAVGQEAGLPGDASKAMPCAHMGQKKALNQYTVNLTEQARQGKLDSVAGREPEIAQW